MRLIGRRDFLASMGLGPGAYLLGSIFKNSLLPEAMGAAPKRKYFFLFTATEGLIESQFTCNARSETDFDLTPCLEPLAPYKKDIVIASKFFNPVDKDQHGNDYAFLSVMPSPDPINNFKTPGGITIDRFIGKQAGASDPFPAVAIGSASQGFVPGADGLRQPLSSFVGPVGAYQSLFAATDAKERSRNKSVVNAIALDINRINSRLAGPEKAKLDQYLTSLRGVEKQLDALQNTQCSAMVPKPAAALAMGKRNAGGYAFIQPEEMDALMSVSFHAHLCGLTRATHLSLFGGAPTYEFLRNPGDTSVIPGEMGFDDSWNFHNIHHRGEEDKITKVNKFLFSKFALWLSLLSKTADPSGSGTMLDNSLVAYINHSGGIHHLGHETYAAVMAGRAGGALKSGRYLAYRQGDYCVSDLFCSWANAMDARTDKFGDKRFSKGPLPSFLS